MGYITLPFYLINFFQSTVNFKFSSKSRFNFEVLITNNNMKNVLIILAIMLSSTLANAQKVASSNVPANVKAALQKNYPNVKEVKWEKEHGNYEAEFKVDGLEYSVVINVSGTILETEVELAENELPQKARTYIATNYKGSKIKEVARITDNKGVVKYEAEVNGKDLLFDSEGNFIEIAH